jgi:hypothetical protein
MLVTAYFSTEELLGASNQVSVHQRCLPTDLPSTEHWGAIMFNKTSGMKHHSGDVPLNSGKYHIHPSSYSEFTPYMHVCSDPMMEQRPLRGSAAHPFTGATPTPGIVAASATIQGASAGAGKSRVSVPRAAYPLADADWRSRTDSQGGGVPRVWWVGVV